MLDETSAHRVLAEVFPFFREGFIRSQQAIDTLLNFAPLTELATAVDDAVFAERERKEFRSVIAERYLAQENFAEAKKFMAPDDFKTVAANLEKLTLAAAGPSQEKAEDMARLGDAWADARGKLLRAPYSLALAGPALPDSLRAHGIAPVRWRTGGLLVGAFETPEQAALAQTQLKRAGLQATLVTRVGSRP